MEQPVDVHFGSSRMRSSDLRYLELLQFYDSRVYAGVALAQEVAVFRILGIVPPLDGLFLLFWKKSSMPAQGSYRF